MYIGQYIAVIVPLIVFIGVIIYAHLWGRDLPNSK